MTEEEFQKAFGPCKPISEIKPPQLICCEEHGTTFINHPVKK
jgi:hypothetical protein